MNPESFTTQLKEICGDNLQAVILYGSAAAGDYTGKQSDYNLLVLLKYIDFPVLKILMAPTEKWSRTGNRPPLLFTRERLLQSVDVFPIEMLDMKQSHKVLFGEDLLEQMDISVEHLRLQVEHELRTKLIALREQYLLTGGRPRALKKLMVQSLSSFLVLFRAALRLYGDEIPTKKLDAVRQLTAKLELDATPFEQVQQLKNGEKVDAVPETLFEIYLSTIVSIIDAVDAQLLSKPE